ncbi:16082_t:CDS:2 [Funneliformis geosporum]|nr:16082_t:CDS:2 [Funneliformis geosporum]
MAENVRNMIAPAFMIINLRHRRNYNRNLQTTHRQGLIIANRRGRTQINIDDTLNRMAQLSYQTTDNIFADHLFNGMAATIFMSVVPLGIIVFGEG